MSIGIITPANDGAITLYSTGVRGTSTHGCERFIGRCGFANVIQAPAGEGAAGSHPAGVNFTNTHGLERTDWRCVCKTGTPANYISVCFYSAIVTSAEADGGE